MSKDMTIHLKYWKQAGPNVPGHFEERTIHGIDEHMSFLEMLDVLNEDLQLEGQDPLEFDYDCREGICGACHLVIDGKAHGPHLGTPSCQVFMRSYKDGDSITIEPFRASAFPIIKDLVVDRGAFDRIIAAGGYVSTKTGSAQEANSIPVEKEKSDMAFNYAACIGCGACVAACPNASASLFTGAKIAHLNKFPQGQVERDNRVIAMVEQMEEEGFGDCSNFGECEAVCPQEISIAAIAEMRSDYVKATFRKS